MALETQQKLIFLGIAGDYSGGADLKMRDRLQQEFSLEVVGNPIRSLSDKEKLIWTVKADQQAKKQLRKMSRPLKKDGYVLDQLRTTAFSLLGSRRSGSALQMALKAVERGDKNIWAFNIQVREGVIWAFHEPRTKSEKLLDKIKKQKVKASFYHQEFELEAKEGADVHTMVGQAKDKLDLVRANCIDQFLVLDLYLRDVEEFLALKRGHRTMACPDLLEFLAEVPGGNLTWSVTLENKAYPFVD
ncbi:MAG: hypothetical protein DWQ01_00195 [Planctomycetota bacterium]|nr:MAG: hypothetical protein DWQ01_00195 [Planctomycetota bacterium]